MPWRARRAILVAIAIGAVVAGCGNEKATGPSAASLARLFDSAFAADSQFGLENPLRPETEASLTEIADWGATGTAVSVTTDGATLSMQMMAEMAYDTTASGLPSDSTGIAIGWTANLNTYVVALAGFGGGADVVPPRRVAVSPRQLATLRSLFARARSRLGALAAAQQAENVVGIVVQGDSAQVSDSATMSVVESPVGGSCAWQHVTFALDNPPDSTLACTPVAMAVSFAFHFPPQTGIDPSLAHMSMAQTTVRGIRLVLALP